MESFYLTVSAIVLSVIQIQGQFADVRCKCVCPSITNGKPQIVVQNIPPEDCKCGLVTKKNETDCLKCECDFQSRNTTTMKVAVIFVICLISFMLLYLLFLEWLDRSSRNRSISVQEEDQADHLASSQQADRVGSLPSGGGCQSSVSAAHRRWNARVQKQREIIFESQAILS